jgi:type II secretory pathway pseudopilin PulG
MNKLLIVLIVAMILAIIGFALSGVVNATAQKSKLKDSINQTNSTQSERQKIIVTWLNTNNTKTSDLPMIKISSKDFWKIFEPLLEPTDRSTGEK